jgi:hypothetical protein
MLFDPHKAQWWGEPAGRPQFIAYYMTLRVHYGYTASEALHKARRNSGRLGIYANGFMQMMQMGINGEIK